MNDLAMSLLLPLSRTTLLAGGAAAIVFTLLRTTRCSSPGPHRLGACLVLVIGWLFLRLPVTIPYYEAPSAEAPEESGGWRSSEASPQDVHPVAPPPFAQPVSTIPPEPSEPHTAVNLVVDAQPPEIVPETMESPSVIAPAVAQATPPVPIAPASKSRRVAWPIALLAVWLTGMITLAVCWTAGYIRFLLRLPQGEPAQAEWTRQWDELLSAAGISAAVPLRMTRRLGPILCRAPDGCRLFLPRDLWERLTPAARLSVLRHELAHYRRRDAWKSLAVRIAALPHWFNPATWWAVRRFDEAAEWACDQAAADGKEAVAFARTLLDLGEPTVQTGCYGPAARGRGLAVRVRRLLATHSMEDSVMKRLLVGVVAFALVIVCLIQFDLVAKQPAAESVAAAEEKAPKPSPPLESLRYDGKSFREWQDELTTELKAERRAEAMEAFAAFGACGCGRESTEVILSVMREMEMPTVFPLHYYNSGLDDKPLVGADLIKSTAIRVFVSDSHGYQIAVTDALPVLTKELKERNRNGRLFAIFVLGSMQEDAAPAVPSLLETLRSDEDAIVRRWAFWTLTRAAADEETTVAAVRLVLQDADPQVVRAALNEFVPLRGELYMRSSGSAKTVFQDSYHLRAATQQPDASFGPRGSSVMARILSSSHMPGERPTHDDLRPEADKIIDMLITAIDDPHPATRLEAIGALGRIGPGAKKAVGNLIRILGKAAPDERDQVIIALVRIGPEAQEVEPLLWQTLRDDERFDMRAVAFEGLAAFEELDPQGVPVLIARLPEGEPCEQVAVAHLLRKFGPDAASAADALRECLANPKEIGVRSSAYGELTTALQRALLVITPRNPPVPPAGSSGLE